MALILSMYKTCIESLYNQTKKTSTQSRWKNCSGNFSNSKRRRKSKKEKPLSRKKGKDNREKKRREKGRRSKIKRIGETISDEDGMTSSTMSSIPIILLIISEKILKTQLIHLKRMKRRSNTS